MYNTLEKEKSIYAPDRVERLYELPQIVHYGPVKFDCIYCIRSMKSQNRLVYAEA